MLISAKYISEIPIGRVMVLFDWWKTVIIIHVIITITIIIITPIVIIIMPLSVTFCVTGSGDQREVYPRRSAAKGTQRT